MSSSDPVRIAMQPVRVLHVLSGDTQAAAIEQTALRSVLAGIPRESVEPLIVRFGKIDDRSVALRLLGVTVHDLGPIRQQFSPVAYRELRAIAQEFRPQILHAWDYPAQSASLALQKDLGDDARILWSMTSTRPRGGSDEQAWLRTVTRGAEHVHAIVYSSRLSVTAHHDAGFPEQRRRIIEPGVDPDLYKPDFAARRRVRQQLNIPATAFVVGMHAPFARHIDHAALIEAVAELAGRHAHLHLLLGGTQVDWHNAAFAALLRKAGDLNGRVHAVGRTIDMEDLYSASDVACSTAMNDSRRLDVAAAMLCGVPCIATAVDAQLELVGDCAIGIRAGSARDLQSALASVLSMAAPQRAALAQRARQHVLQNYTVKRAVARYHRLYEKLLGFSAPPERDETEASQSDP